MFDGLRGHPLVPGPGDPAGEQEVHGGRGHVEPRLHRCGDVAGQAIVPGHQHHQPD